MEASHDVVRVVLDIGSGSCRAGFAGEDGPRTAFPSIVGRPVGKCKPPVPGKETFIGDDAQSKRGILRMTYPIEAGGVTNWDDLEHILYYAFHDELRLEDMSDHPVLLTDGFAAGESTTTSRERAVQSLFETFSLPALFIHSQAVLSLCASGRTTGIVLDLGDSISHAVPVYEGHHLPRASRLLHLGGRLLDQHMVRLLSSSGFSFTCNTDRDLPRAMKEALCYVALDLELEGAKHPSELGKEFTLPDGNVVTIGRERFLCPEALFDPGMINLPSAFRPIHEQLFNSLILCDPDIRQGLYKNVLLSGGSSMFPGLAERLRRELVVLAPDSAEIEVEAHPVSRYLAWIGGSIVASTNAFQPKWIAKEEYDEVGPGIVNRKCF